MQIKIKPQILVTKSQNNTDHAMCTAHNQTMCGAARGQLKAFALIKSEKVS